VPALNDLKWRVKSVEFFFVFLIHTQGRRYLTRNSEEVRISFFLKKKKKIALSRK